MGTTFTVSRGGESLLLRCRLRLYRLWGGLADFSRSRVVRWIGETAAGAGEKSSLTLTLLLHIIFAGKNIGENYEKGVKKW